jgi:hypothetical protein
MVGKKKTPVSLADGQVLPSRQKSEGGAGCEGRGGQARGAVEPLVKESIPVGEIWAVLVNLYRVLQFLNFFH